MNVFNCFRKISAAGIAGVYFFCNVLGAHAAESNFWQDRRARIARRIPSGLGSAQNPSTGGVNLGEFVTPVGGSLQRLGEETVPSATSLPSSAQKTFGWLPAVIAPYGDIRDIYVSPRPGGPVVVHIQDIHEVEEAQRNISGIVAGLTSRSGVSLVGLEGATGSFRLEPYRQYPDKDVVRGVADLFITLGYFSGPEAAAITSDQRPLLWGLEDPALYRDNILAFHAAERIRDRARASLAPWTSAIVRARQKVYSPALQKLDELCRGFHEHRVRLGVYAQGLWTAWKDDGRRFNNVRLLLEALEKEGHLNFSDVEKERRRLVESLARRLSPMDLNRLIKESLDHRAGKVSMEVYRRFLRRLCDDSGIALDRYPLFDAYLAYVLLTERMDRDALLEELSELEDAALTETASTPAERALLRAQRDTSLFEKLATHGLTPAQWREYSAARLRWRDVPDVLSGVVGQPVPPAMTPEDRAPFEEFCTRALERNDALVDNLLKKARTENASKTILVAGGFHTEGISRRLRAAGVSYAVVTPRLTSTGLKDMKPLDVFTRAPTPLEHLVSGEFIRLAYPRLTSTDVGSSPEPGAPARADDAEVFWAALMETLKSGSLTTEDFLLFQRWALEFGAIEDFTTELFEAGDEGRGLAVHIRSRNGTRHGFALVTAPAAHKETFSHIQEKPTFSALVKLESGDVEVRIYPLSVARPLGTAGLTWESAAGWLCSHGTRLLRFLSASARRIGRRLVISVGEMDRLHRRAAKRLARGVLSSFAFVLRLGYGKVLGTSGSRAQHPAGMGRGLRGVDLRDVPLYQEDEVRGALDQLKDVMTNKLTSMLANLPQEVGGSLSAKLAAMGTVSFEQGEIGLFDSDLLRAQYGGTVRGFGLSGDDREFPRLALASAFFQEGPLGVHRSEALFHELYHVAFGASEGSQTHENALRLQALLFWGLSPDEAAPLSVRDLERHEKNGLGRALSGQKVAHPPTKNVSPVTSDSWYPWIQWGLLGWNFPLVRALLKITFVCLGWELAASPASAEPARESTAPVHISEAVQDSLPLNTPDPGAAAVPNAISTDRRQGAGHYLEELLRSLDHVRTTRRNFIFKMSEIIDLLRLSSEKLRMTLTREEKAWVLSIEGPAKPGLTSLPSNPDLLQRLWSAGEQGEMSEAPTPPDGPHQGAVVTGPLVREGTVYFSAILPVTGRTPWSLKKNQVASVHQWLEAQARAGRLWSDEALKSQEPLERLAITAQEDTTPKAKILWEIGGSSAEQDGGFVPTVEGRSLLADDRWELDDDRQKFHPSVVTKKFVTRTLNINIASEDLVQSDLWKVIARVEEIYPELAKPGLLRREWADLLTAQFGLFIERNPPVEGARLKGQSGTLMKRTTLATFSNIIGRIGLHLSDREKKIAGALTFAWWWETIATLNIPRLKVFVGDHEGSKLARWVGLGFIYTAMAAAGWAGYTWAGEPSVAARLAAGLLAGLAANPLTHLIWNLATVWWGWELTSGGPSGTGGPVSPRIISDLYHQDGDLLVARGTDSLAELRAIEEKNRHSNNNGIWSDPVHRQFIEAIELRRSQLWARLTGVNSGSPEKQIQQLLIARYQGKRLSEEPLPENLPSVSEALARVVTDHDPLNADEFGSLMRFADQTLSEILRPTGNHPRVLEDFHILEREQESVTALSFRHFGQFLSHFLGSPRPLAVADLGAGRGLFQGSLESFLALFGDFTVDRTRSVAVDRGARPGDPVQRGDIGNPEDRARLGLTPASKDLVVFNNVDGDGLRALGDGWTMVRPGGALWITVTRDFVLSHRGTQSAVTAVLNALPGSARAWAHVVTIDGMGYPLSSRDYQPALLIVAGKEAQGVSGTPAPVSVRVKMAVLAVLGLALAIGVAWAAVNPALFGLVPGAFQAGGLLPFAFLGALPRLSGGWFKAEAWRVPRLGDSDWIVVPDLDARVDVMERILRAENLLKPDGTWARDGPGVLQVGDIVGRGKGSLAALSRVLEWQAAAVAVNRPFVILLGNHEKKVLLEEPIAGDFSPEEIQRGDVKKARNLLAQAIVDKHIKVAHSLTQNGFEGLETHAGLRVRTLGNIVQLNEYDVWMNSRNSKVMTGPADFADFANSAVVPMAQAILEGESGKEIKKQFRGLLDQNYGLFGATGILDRVARFRDDELALPYPQIFGHTVGRGVRHQTVPIPAPEPNAPPRGVTLNVDGGIGAGAATYARVRAHGETRSVVLGSLGARRLYDPALEGEDPRPVNVFAWLHELSDLWALWRDPVRWMRSAAGNANNIAELAYLVHRFEAHLAHRTRWLGFPRNVGGVYTAGFAAAVQAVDGQLGYQPAESGESSDMYEKNFDGRLGELEDVFRALGDSLSVSAVLFKWSRTNNPPPAINLEQDGFNLSSNEPQVRLKEVSYRQQPHLPGLYELTVVYPQDRPGILAALGAALAANGFAIESASIASPENVVADRFLVMFPSRVQGEDLENLQRNVTADLRDLMSEKPPTYEAIFRHRGRAYLFHKPSEGRAIRSQAFFMDHEESRPPRRVLQIRGADRVESGLFHAITRFLFERGYNVEGPGCPIRTRGLFIFDEFIVTHPDGSSLTSEEEKGVAAGLKALLDQEVIGDSDFPGQQGLQAPRARPGPASEGPDPHRTKSGPGGFGLASFAAGLFVGSAVAATALAFGHLDIAFIGGPLAALLSGAAVQDLLLRGRQGGTVRPMILAAALVLAASAGWQWWQAAKTEERIAALEVVESQTWRHWEDYAAFLRSRGEGLEARRAEAKVVLLKGAETDVPSEWRKNSDKGRERFFTVLGSAIKILEEDTASVQLVDQMKDEVAALRKFPIRELSEATSTLFDFAREIVPNPKLHDAFDTQRSGACGAWRSIPALPPSSGAQGANRRGTIPRGFNGGEPASGGSETSPASRGREDRDRRRRVDFWNRIEDGKQNGWQFSKLGVGEGAEVDAAYKPGEGPLIVWIYGGGNHPRLDEMMEFFSNRPVLVLRRRPANDPKNLMDQNAQDTIAALDQLETRGLLRWRAEGVIVIGHSMGAHIAGDVALRLNNQNPSVLKGLALLNPPFPHPGWYRFLIEWVDFLKGAITVMDDAMDLLGFSKKVKIVLREMEKNKWEEFVSSKLAPDGAAPMEGHAQPSIPWILFDSWDQIHAESSALSSFLHSHPTARVEELKALPVPRLILGSPDDPMAGDTNHFAAVGHYVELKADGSPLKEHNPHAEKSTAPHLILALSAYIDGPLHSPESLDRGSFGVDSTLPSPAGGRWPIFERIYVAVGGPVGFILLPVLLESLWPLVLEVLGAGGGVPVWGVALYQLGWHLIHLIGARGSWAQRLAFAFSKDKLIVTLGVLCGFGWVGQEGALTGVSLVGIFALPHAIVNAIEWIRWRGNVRLISSGLLSAGIIGEPASSKIDYLAYEVDSERLAGHAARSLTRTRKLRERVAGGLGLELNVPLATMAETLGELHSRGGGLESVSLPWEGLGSRQIGEVSTLIALASLEESRTDLPRMTAQQVIKHYLLGQGLMGFDDWVNGNANPEGLDSDARRIGFSVPSALFEDESRWDERDRSIFASMAIIARMPRETKERFVWILPPGRRVDELSRLFNSHGTLSSLSSGLLDRQVAYTPAVGSNGKRSLLALLKRIQGVENPNLLRPMDLFLLDRGEWDESGLPTELQREFAIFILLAGGVVFRATDPISQNLKRIIAVANKA